MLEFIVTIAIFIALVIPVGNYLYHISTGQKTFADPVMDRIDGVIYKISGVRPDKGMNWWQYAIALLTTNAVMVLIGYLILRIQSISILNPNGIASMEETLSFNTIISFMTNTNLQHYSGESGLSYFSQLLVITFMMFVSAASGYAACIAFIRGLAGKTKECVGNFYMDLVRVTTRILLPFSFVGGLLLVWQGVPQNLGANIVVDTIEGMKQTIATGPVAAVEIIKHLGTNGGGFFGANSTTPMENPTIISNLIELYSMMLLPGACVITFGKMVRDRKAQAALENDIAIKSSLTTKFFGREGRSIFLAMGILFVIGGVLFIDEAYSITENENSDSYGRECLTELTKALEDYREDLVVIVAGYTEPMRNFFESNPGLKSRFNTFIEFPDYNADELDQILCSICRKNDYVLESDASAVICEYLKKCVEEKGENFANGRLARNLYDDLVMNHARRVIKITQPTKEDLCTIVKDDFQPENQKVK